jgi:hypothetical protein
MSTSAMPASVAKRFGYVLKRAQHALRISLDNALRPLGLTTPQYADERDNSHRAQNIDGRA